MRGLDKNSDGKLQKTEMPERFRNLLFDRLDADGNSELSKEELQTLRDFLNSLKAKKETASIP